MYLDGDTTRAELREVLRRLRDLQGTPAPKDELLVALGVMSEVAGAYCDASFARAMTIVHEVSGRLPKERAASLRKSLHRAVQSFGGQETEFRRQAYQALALLDRVDRRTAGEARSLFESAVRAERLLVQGAFSADAGDTGGMIRGLEEFDDLLASNSKAPRTRKIKLCMLGDGAVGKTSLIRRYVTGTFTDRYEETVGARITEKTVLVPDGDGSTKEIVAGLWDIMGHELLGRLRQSYVMSADAAVLVVSASDKKSAASSREWVRLLDQTVGKVPVAVLVNKMDLAKPDARREEVADLATSISAQVVSTSAKTGEKVAEGIDSLVARAVR